MRVIILVPAAVIGQGWDVGREHAYHLILGLPVRWVARFSYYKWRPPREKKSQCKQDLNSGACALKHRVRSPLGRQAYLIFTGRHSSLYSLCFLAQERLLPHCPSSPVYFHDSLNNFLYLKERNAKHGQEEGRATLPEGCRGMINNSKEFFPPPTLYHPAPVLQSVLPRADSLPPSGH